MRRHGWAFCLGLLLSGLAAAQPPAGSERYPPAPDLPGVVVGQTNAGQPVGTAASATTKLASLQPAEPMPAPKPLDAEPKPAGPTITATTEPLGGTPVPPDGPVAPGTTCGTPEKDCKEGCGSGGCLARIADWCSFHSHARQHGCYPSPYRPPLFTWFPCGPRNKPWSACPSGNCGVGGPGVVPPPPGPQELPVPEPAPVGPPPRALGENVNPNGVPGAAAAPDQDLPGSIRVDTGLRFSPGAAPMARPTTQTDRVSTWRPK